MKKCNQDRSAVVYVWAVHNFMQKISLQQSITKNKRKNKTETETETEVRNKKQKITT